MSGKPIQPMPEGPDWHELKAGAGLRAMFQRKRDRPSIVYGRDDAEHQLLRNDGFAVENETRDEPPALHGHCHVLPISGEGQIPYDEVPGMTPAQNAFAHSKNIPWVREKLREANAGDLADNVPDEVILSIATQAEEQYAALQD